MMFPIKLSRILLTFRVRDIGLISVVIDFGGCAFGIGVTCALFQSIGMLPSDSDLLNMAHGSGPIRPAKSLNPIRSGEGDFKSPPPPSMFALTHLILELHYCALGNFPKKIV